MQTPDARTRISDKFPGKIVEFYLDGLRDNLNFAENT